MLDLNDETFFQVIKENNLVFIDFYASWCGSCRMAAPMFKRVAEEENVKIYKVDVEKNPKVKDLLQLPSLPSVGCFKNGEPQDLVSVTKEDLFREFIVKMKNTKS